MLEYETEQFLKRFWSKVDKQGKDECWNWLAPRTYYGYGQVNYEGRPHIASRMSWRIHNGEIPSELCVLHHCDNRICVNPDHLFLGTRTDNMVDKCQKGRHPKGEDAWNCKLTEDAVRVIRIYVECGMSHTEMARHLGLSRTTIRDAVSGKNWSHV
jgi:hypothetical protein